MKKLALAVVVLVSFSQMSFAAPAAVPAVPAAPAVAAAPVAAVKPAVVDVKMLAGKVDAVVVADPVKGTKSSLQLVNEQGQKALFLVEPMTVITDAAGKALALGSLANGTVVQVAYVLNKGGVNEAVAVKLTK